MQSQIPSGLRSLIGQQLPEQQAEKAPFPRGMMTLIQAQRALKTLANPVTPDGTPTIAGATEQAAQQALAQQGIPQGPQGMPLGMPPGMPPTPSPQMQPQPPGTVPQAAAMAGIAGQQQMAQMQQPPAGPPQTPPQGMAHGGLASLPADNLTQLKYARGGILGFDGQERSDVPESDDTTDVERLLRLHPAPMVGQTMAQSTGQQPPEFDIDWSNPSQVKQLRRAIRNPNIPQDEREAISNQLKMMGFEDPQQMLKRYNEVLERRRALESQIADQPKPSEFTRDMMMEELKKRFPTSSFDTSRSGIADLAAKQEAIMSRNKELYEQEKASRPDKRFWEALAGIGQFGIGGSQVRTAAFDEAIRKRDEDFTRQMEADRNFALQLFNLTNTTNTAERNEMREDLLGKITDYRQASALFSNDRKALLESLRKEEGNILSNYAKMYVAENKPAARTTDQEKFADNYVASKRAEGDTRPESEIRQEAYRFLFQQKGQAGARVEVAEKKEWGDRIKEATDAVDKLLDKMNFSQEAQAIKKRIKEMGNTDEARAIVRAEMLRQRMKERGVPESYWPSVPSTTAAPSGTTPPPGYDPSKVRLKGP